MAARSLVQEGALEVTQKGRVLEMGELYRGAIRLRLPASSGGAGAGS